jgi:hypothetical protein
MGWFAQELRCEATECAMNDLVLLDQKGFEGKLVKEFHWALGSVSFGTKNGTVKRIQYESRQVHRR